MNDSGVYPDGRFHLLVSLRMCFPHGIQDVLGLLVTGVVLAFGIGQGQEMHGSNVACDFPSFLHVIVESLGFLSPRGMVSISPATDKGVVLIGLSFV